MKHCVSLDILADYIGVHAVSALVYHHGGASIKIPKRAHGSVWARLCQAMGAQASATLVQHFGGETLYIATNHRQAVAQRRAQALAMQAEGKSISDIARELHITTRYTERGLRKLIGSAPEAHPQQLSLLPEPHPLQAALYGLPRMPAKG